MDRTCIAKTTFRLEPRYNTSMKIVKVEVDYRVDGAFSCHPRWDTKFEFPLDRLDEQEVETIKEVDDLLEPIFRDCNAIDEDSWILTENSGLRTRSMSVGDHIIFTIEEQLSSGFIKKHDYIYRVEGCGFKLLRAVAHK